MEDIIIGVDLAKRIFQLHGATGSGEILFRKRLTPDQFLDFMSRQSPSSVVFEGCSNSSYWAREMQAFGHEVRLIAPQYVKPFAKRQKNDATDVEAVDVAARQPEMRFVSPKSVPESSEPASV
jgi:transposase